MRSAFRRGDQDAIRVSRKEKRAVARENAALKPGERLMPTLQYAWCLEPHESGYPHVHLVTNANRVGTLWLKRQWSRIVQAKIQFAGNQAVKDVSGTCAYLSKYISKTWFTDDISAILYRRRQWASTRKDTLKKTSTWVQEKSRASDRVALEITHAKSSAAALGLDLVASKDGEYALQEYSMSFEQWRDKPWTRRLGFGTSRCIEIKECLQYDAIEAEKAARRYERALAVTLGAPLEGAAAALKGKAIDWLRLAQTVGRLDDGRMRTRFDNLRPPCYHEVIAEEMRDPECRLPTPESTIKPWGSLLLQLLESRETDIFHTIQYRSAYQSGIQTDSSL